MEPVTPTEIAREFGMSLSTVLFRTNRNVDLGRVERVANPQDGRSFLVRLTPEGRRLWTTVGAALRKEVEGLERRLDRPADQVHEMLIAFQAAADAQLAAGEVPARR
jgi:DNA-binding MarR family transcriptional regulator